MFGLRQKLLFGFGGLLAILLLVSGLGVAVLTQYRGALDKFYYENWRSIEYGQNMVDSLEKLNDIAKSISGADHEPSQAELTSTAQSAAGSLNEFDDNSRAENGNITLDGEDKIASQLTQLWNGENLKGEKLSNDSYRDLFLRLLSPGTNGSTRTATYFALMRVSPQLKTQAHAVIKLNQDNMKPIEGRAKSMADD